MMNEDNSKNVFLFAKGLKMGLCVAKRYKHDIRKRNMAF